jgi:hypothetical protein
MKLQVALIMAGISIILLAIYGADAMWSIGKSHGFLPLDVRTRGMALGFPSVILPVISYIITRNVASKTLGAMIAVAGVFMFGGSAAFLGMQDPTGDPNQLRSSISSLAVIFAGIIISVLGAIKIRKS